jgi:hypothetical protein
MRIARYILIVSVMLGVIGFAAAALLDKRQLGMTIFLVGFFVGAASAVFIALTSASGNFGKLGTAIKIAAGGFGLIVFGQMVSFLLGNDGLIGKVFFFVGIAVMMIGIVVAALRMAKF